MKKLAIITIFSILMTGCATAPPTKDYSKFNAAGIRSILVIPVVNNSVEVSASDYFLSTVPIPVAEHGYYVFPVNLVKRVLEDDGLSDANLVHSASTEKLCELFGADAALYIIINRWEAQYIVFSTRVTVELTYVLKDGVAGEEIWRDEETMVYAPQNSSSGNPLADLIAMAIVAAIAKAKPNYIPLARQANQKAFAYPGAGFPHGPYAKNKASSAEEK